MNGELSTTVGMETTQCTDDSFTFKKKSQLDTTQTTTNSIISKGSSKLKVRNFRRANDNNNILGEQNNPKLQQELNNNESDSDDDNILSKMRPQVTVKLTIYLWLPKLQHAEEMLLNEERTDLRTDVKLISPLVKKQSEMFDKIVHYYECTETQHIQEILERSIKELQQRFINEQSHIFLSQNTELYRVKIARSNGIPDCMNNISSDRSVKDLQCSSYFIDYSPMALVLNNEHDDIDQERLRTYESFTGNSFTFYQKEDNEQSDDMISNSIRKERSSVVTSGEDLRADSSDSLQTFKPNRRSKKQLDDFGQGEKACECTIF